MRQKTIRSNEQMAFAWEEAGAGPPATAQGPDTSWATDRERAFDVEISPLVIGYPKLAGIEVQTLSTIPNKGP